MSLSIMPPEEMKFHLARMAAMVDQYLDSCLNRFAKTPARLKEAMLYSLQAGGKRLRPALCMASASLCGLEENRVIPFAAAIEMIHTYSLIHDDLPAMDNDDLRRGKPSNHKQFDEATAILAGDGLLTDAFAVAASVDLPARHVLAALVALAHAAGSSGMAGGQMLDMEYTARNNITINQITEMQVLKTGAMLEASCVCGALLAGADAPLINAMKVYGSSLGKAFQIADDILDLTASTEELGKPAGSDVAHGKNTYPSLLGIEKSRSIALEEAEKAQKALPDCKQADFLRSLANYAVTRKS